MNDNRLGPLTTDPDPPATDQAASPAVQRFHACRWRKPAESGLPEHCSHRDVLPMAGTTGFVPEAWCPECPYFKAKRTPRRPAEREEAPPQNPWWK